MKTVESHLVDIDILLGLLEKLVKSKNLSGNPENLFGYLRVSLADCNDALPAEVLEIEAGFEKPFDSSDL